MAKAKIVRAIEASGRIVLMWKSLKQMERKPQTITRINWFCERTLVKHPKKKYQD